MDYFNFSSIENIYLIIGMFATPLVFSLIRRAIRSLMEQTKATRAILRMFECLLSAKWLLLVGELFFVLLFCFLYLLQKKFSLIILELNSSDFKFVEIYSFVIGILSMYGIYIVFLQFIIGDSEKNRYLGKNKIKYLTDTSIWYQVTQTKSFLSTLFLLILLPVLIINPNC